MPAAIASLEIPNIIGWQLFNPQGIYLKGRLSKVMKPDDSLRYYSLCAECLPKVEAVNGPPIEKAQLYFMV